MGAPRPRRGVTLVVLRHGVGEVTPGPVAFLAAVVVRPVGDPVVSFVDPFVASAETGQINSEILQLFSETVAALFLELSPGHVPPRRAILVIGEQNRLLNKQTPARS